MAEKCDFGIVLTNGSEMAEYGCTARVYSLIKNYPDGKMDINVIGREKFKLNDYAVGENLYIEAEVDIVEDIVEDLSDDLLDSCIELYNFITNKIPVFRVQQTKKEELVGKKASYFFAQKAGLIPKQKQTLLEMNSENERLAYIKEHLQRIKPSVSKAIEIEKIVRNDGYLAPKDLK
jgi:Lon protease-like protein